VKGALIGVRVDGDGSDAQAPGGPDDTAGNLATVGNQDLLEHSGRLPGDAGMKKAAKT
jgi:hypothetical protein